MTSGAGPGRRTGIASECSGRWGSGLGGTDGSGRGCTSGSACSGGSRRAGASRTGILGGACSSGSIGPTKGTVPNSSASSSSSKGTRPAALGSTTTTAGSGNGAGTASALVDAALDGAGDFPCAASCVASRLAVAKGRPHQLQTSVVSLSSPHHLQNIHGLLGRAT